MFLSCLSHRNKTTDAAALARVLSSKPPSTMLGTFSAGSGPARPAKRHVQLKRRLPCCSLSAPGAVQQADAQVLPDGHTLEVQQPQERRQQRKEGMKLLVLVAALHDPHKEHRIPHCNPAKAVGSDIDTCMQQVCLSAALCTFEL